MDRKYHEKQAMKFMKEGSCYIHVEMKDEKAEQILSGNGNELIYCLTKLVERISVRYGTSFETALETIKSLHDFCEEEKKEGRYKK